MAIRNIPISSIACTAYQLISNISLDYPDCGDAEAVLKIYFLGAGALGCAIGGTLAAAASDVTLIDRYQAHVDAINRNGLVMRDSGSERTVRVKAATDCGGLAPADLVIVL